jgi:uncharacterized membrane protein YfcA
LENLLALIEPANLLIVCVLTFIAGFLDAVVGGGGLITIPALLINFPTVAVPSLFGTNKIASLSGTSIAAYHFSKKIKFDFKILLSVGICAASASFLGAQIMNRINVNALKPLIFFILIFIAIYTFIKKDFGKNNTTIEMPINKSILLGCFLGLIIGFYDGFFGPGTGSFLIMGFIWLLGFDFLKASAYSKIINCITNFSAIVVFVSSGYFILELALILAVCNISGNYFGSKIAIKKGNEFIRIIFLIIVSIMILRYGYEIFIK